MDQKRKALGCMAINKLNLFDGIFKNKKVLVTGDSGFKGSWLALWLLKLDADVYGYSLKPEDKSANFEKINLSEKIAHKTADIRDKISVENYINQINPEIIFHLAAQPIVLESVENPVYTYETNVMGTVNVCEAIRKSNSVKAAVIVTSDKVYENRNLVWGYRENDELGGKDPYSASKACCELVVNSYRDTFLSEKHSCIIATARAGNVIGGGDWGKYRIIPDFFRSIQDKTKLNIRNPYFTRPWQYVLEPLYGYLLLASKIYQYGKMYEGSWNFGPGDMNHLTVLELIDKMIDISGKGEYTYSDKIKKTIEAKLLKLDISKAVNELKWKPILNIDECAEYTTYGYIAENENTNLFNERLKQIDNFSELVTKRNIISN